MRSAERTPGKLPRLAIGLAAALALVLGLCPAIALAGEVEVEGAGGPMVVTQDKGDGTEEPSVLVQGQGEEPALEAQAGDEHKHDGETFQPWESTTSMPTTGNYYLTEDVKLSERWDVMQTVRLCLNGHSVTYVGTDATVYMIFVWGNCTLDLYDETGAGVISGGGKTVHPCISLNGSSVFNMHGGTITGGGSEKSHDGGGVWVYNGSTFNMDGGTITGNRAYYGGGVFVEERGTFNMSGATVTRNSAQTGGGVFLAGGHSSSEGESAPAATMSVSGDAAVCGNTDAGGTLASNVFLGAGGSVGEEGILTHDPALDAKVTVAGALSDGASIGVTMQEPGTFTTGFKDKMGAADPAKYFASDSDEYAVTTDAQGEGTLAKGYKVTVAGGIQNGTVSVDKAKAAAGDSVKVTTEAAEGYELDTVTVRATNGTQIQTKDGSSFFLKLAVAVTSEVPTVSVAVGLVGPSTDAPSPSSVHLSNSKPSAGVAVSCTVPPSVASLLSASAVPPSPGLVDTKTAWGAMTGLRTSTGAHA